MSIYPVDSMLDSGYGGFVFSARVAHGKGTKTVGIRVPLETVLELAAAYHLCPSPSAGHAVHHVMRRKLSPCGTESQPAEDVALVEKIRAKLLPWRRRAKAGRLRS